MFSYIKVSLHKNGRSKYNRNIQAIKALFKNVRDTLSREEINDIRTKIYKNTKLYEHYANKANLNNKETKSLNKAINNLNKLHKNLLIKEASIDVIHPMSLINYLSMNTTNP